jgi:hypothetical protein
MASMQESIALIHRARNLIQRVYSPKHPVQNEELLEFLADSESFIVDGCGHRARYLDKGN